MMDVSLAPATPRRLLKRRASLYASPPMEPGLKRKILIAGSAGAGAILMAALVLAVVLWKRSRPKPPPPRPWNTTALIGQEPPGFRLVSIGEKKLISFSFLVENTTSDDYEFRPLRVKLMVKYKDGSLQGPISAPRGTLSYSAFIPAKQRGHITIWLSAREAPEKSARESEQDYHERLRGYLQKHFKNVSGFVLYDEMDHYQLNLPRWRSEPRQEPAPAEKEDSLPK